MAPANSAMRLRGDTGYIQMSQIQGVGVYAEKSSKDWCAKRED